MISKRQLFLFPYLLVFYEITNYLANDMYLPALPHMTAELDTTAAMAQQSLTTWFLGTASLQLLLGPLSDRWGRRPIFFLGGMVFMLSTLACALTPNINFLLIARFFQGCAVCFVLTAGYSSIHELYSQTTAIKILALMGSITVIAPAFGPLVGGIILIWCDWRWIFGLLFLWALIALVTLWRVMPESNPKNKRHPLEPRVLMSNYISILKNGKFWVNTLIVCLPFLGMIAWIVAGPFLVISKFQMGTLTFGVFQALIFGCLILGAQTVKKLIDKIGPQRLINLGLMICFLAGSLAWLMTFLFPDFIYGLVLCLIFFSYGSALAFGPAQRLAIEACKEPMGARMAAFSTLMSLFGAIGGLLVALTYNDTLIWFGLLLFVVAVLAALARGLEQRFYEEM